MRSILFILPLALSAFATSSDMRLDEAITSGDRALAVRMSELSMDRCVRQQYNPTVALAPSTQVKFSALPVVKRLYRSEMGWVKAEVTGGGAWDNIYYLEAKNAVICGEQGWQKLADSSAVRFYDVRSQAPQVASPPPATVDRLPNEQRAIAFRWEGEARLIAGVVTLQQRSRAGNISAKLPSGDGECTGVFEAASNGNGQWALSCTNGLTVVGTFTALGQGKGSVGTGTDSKGKRVEFTLAGTP